MSAPALEVHGLSKSFGGVPALHPLDWTVAAGEVHALVGQNGCGKSTLVKSLTGYHKPDSGAVSVFGERLSLPVAAPTDHGIAVIHQDVGLVHSMTVLENLGVSARYGTGLLRPVDVASESRTYSALFERLGIAIPLTATVADLSPAEHALIGIVRVMRLLDEDAQHLFILDEPTAYLSRTEASRITSFMRRVADLGSSVIFISHRLGEVLDNCDAVTVLRDGRHVATHRTQGTTRHDLVAEMLGRRLTDFYPDPPRPPTATSPAIAVRGLSAKMLDDVSFEVRPGEILGVTGLAGMGQEELPLLMAGAGAPTSGSVVVGDAEDEPVEITRRLKRAIDRGVALVPGNRHRDGCWLDGSATENVTLPSLHRIRGRAGQIRRREEREVSHRLLTLSRVRPLAPDKPLRELSGGNQQKIVLSKWLDENPRVLVLDEPTQGVDAGASRELLEKVTALAEQGTAVVLCSGDYEQIAAVCHRAIVLSHGHVVAELAGAELTESALLHACDSEAAAPST